MIAKTLDITGDACPITFVKTKLMLEDMAVGEVLEVFLSSGAPLTNVPRSARADGHEVLLIEAVDDYHRVLIRKGVLCDE